MTDAVVTLPIAPEHFYIGLAILGLILLTGLIFAMLDVTGRDYRRPTWEDIPENWRGIAIFLGLVWLGLFALTVIAAYSGVWQMIHPKDSQAGGNLGLGALLAAMLGAPFVIWATWIKQRTLALSETSLFNDKVNAAVAALHSRRQVTREIIVDSESTILTEWQDDIVQRSAAIDRLEGLMHERPSEVPRIVNMLSVYIRELSREVTAKDHPRTKWLALLEPANPSPPMGEAEALKQLGMTPDDVSVDAMQVWARGLRPFRTDVEKAAQTLGRVTSIPNIDEKAIQIDLRGMNGQGFDLGNLNFSYANLSGARLEGAYLGEARMEGATLSEARMEGANLRQARMEGADLRQARMEGADLRQARMEGADLSEARMEGAILWQARMEGADLSEARMDSSTTLTAALLRGAAVRVVDYTDVKLSQDQIDQMFGDGSVKLPEGLTRPKHWPDWKMRWNEFEAEWRRWQAEPETYIPPPKPEDEA